MVMDALAVIGDKRSDMVTEAVERLKGTDEAPGGRLSQSEVREIAKPVLRRLDETWDDDKEASHVLYDMLIGAILCALGFGRMVDRFDRKEKWYG